MAKILIFDIESAPNLGYVWGKYEQNILSYERETYLLCYAYKWYKETNTKVVALPDFESYKDNPSNDKELVQTLWNLFEQADIIIAHNGDQFDIKYANGRFLYHGLTPPQNYKTVDTLKVARGRFKLNSNKLNDLGTLLQVGKKVETGGFELWLGCMAGDDKAWKKMKKYNKQDVELLEQVYIKLLPWIKNHPNLNFMNDVDRPQCPYCQSEKVWKLGLDKSMSNPRQRWRCMGCGANLYTSTKSQVLRS